MIKSERGSITSFVLSMCLLILFILVGVFMRNQNKIINQKQQLQTTEQRYSGNNLEEEMAQKYDEIVKKEEENAGADLKIATAAELKDFANQVNSGQTFEGKTIILTSNIDMASICSSSSQISWTPIGNSTHPFKGVFDGRDYTIENIYVNHTTTDCQGLFGYNSGTLKNIRLTSGNITGRRWVAGIAGYNFKSIVSCYSNATLSSTASSDNGMVSQIGGIAGTNEGTIEKCWNTGSISALSNQCGGIAGYNMGTIKECYNKGELSATVTHLGGITGLNGYEKQLRTGKIKDCYNVGNIKKTTWYAGGICGQNQYGEVANCYNIGTIEATNCAGGIEGAYLTNSTNSNTYYLSTVAASDRSIAKTEQELKNLVSTLGEAFREDTGNKNQGYPILNWQR